MAAARSFPKCATALGRQKQKGKGAQKLGSHRHNERSKGSSPS